MIKRRMWLILLLCFSAGSLTFMTLFQACSLANDSGVSEEMTEEQQNRKPPKTAREWERERQRLRKEHRKKAAESKQQRLQKWKEDAKEGRGPLVPRDKTRKKLQETSSRIKREFLREKAALGVTEDQWQHIKPKLEKIRQLRDQANSAVGASLSGGSSAYGKKAAGPAFQWRIPWKDKPRDELTEAQRLAQQLITFLGRKNTTEQAFRIKMSALRKARAEEAQIEKRLAEARRELCEILTTRQEAALVLMNRL